MTSPAQQTEDLGPYVLRESLASRQKGEPVFPGPACTRDLNEAARFANRSAAYRSPAYSFGLTFFKPVRLADALEELASAYGVTPAQMLEHLAGEVAA